MSDQVRVAMQSLHDVDTKILAVARSAIPQAEFTVVGGAVRDALMGRTPKDYDVCVVLPLDCHDDATMFQYTERIVRYMRYVLDAAVVVHRAYGIGGDASRGDFNDCMWACVKVTLPEGLLLDFLFTKAHSVQEHVANHDCNMNMLYYKDGIVSAELPAELVWNPSAEVSQTRRVYMQAKFDAWKAGTDVR